MSLLTDETEKTVTAPEFIIHFVNKADTSQDPAGSSFSVSLDNARQGILNTDKFTAFSTGGQGSATPLLAYDCLIETAAALGDSVLALPAIVSMSQEVFNDTANAVDVFPTSGNNFKGLAADVAISLGAGSRIKYRCYTAGELVI